MEYSLNQKAKMQQLQLTSTSLVLSGTVSGVPTLRTPASIETPTSSAICCASRSIFTSKARIAANLGDAQFCFRLNDAQQKSVTAYCASCSNIVDAFITSRLCTGPMLMPQY